MSATTLPRPLARLLPVLALALVGDLLPAQEVAAQRQLILEAPDGTLRRLPAQGLELEDPRAEGAWFVRPEGFPAEPNGVRDSAAAGHRAEVELVSGDVLRGHLVGGEGEVLQLELAGGIRLGLEVSRILRIRLPEQLAGLVGPIDAPAEGDRLYRRTVGANAVLDPTDGTFESFTEQGLRFESRALGLRDHPWSEVAGLTLEVLDEGSDGQADAQGGTPVVLDLADGGRLAAALERMEATGCHVRVVGVETFFAWGTLHEVSVNDGRLVFLSDLVAREEVGRGSPFSDSGDELGMVWSHRVDRSVVGGPLVTAGRAWGRGLDTHTPTRVTWDLGSADRSLRGWVGIDDSAARNPPGARGTVIFRVLVDGEVAWESPLVRSGEPALALPPVDLSGHSELTLEADMAGDFRGDRANWLRPLILR